MDFILDFFNFLTEFLTTDIYDLLKNAFAFWLVKFEQASISFLIWAVSFSWDVAKTIINDLGLSSALQSSFNLIDSNTMQLVYYLKIPEMLNIILNGVVTRYVLNFIPFV